MKRATLGAVLLILLVLPRPVAAQWVVFDPSTFAQAVAIVQQVQSQYALWQQMSTGLANIGVYRIPGLDAPLLVPRTLTAPSVLPPLSETYAGLIGPRQAALGEKDSRLTATLEQMQRLQQFSAAINMRLQALQADVTAPTRTMQGSLDTIAAAEYLRAQQDERNHAVQEQMLDLQVQAALRDRDAQARELEWRAQQLAAPPMDIGADIYVNGWLR